jgi:hypothetical protein
MKSLRPILIVLAWTISVLMTAQPAAAGGGKGPAGGTAAVAIDSVLLINPTHPSDRFTRAEIAGGGFLNGDSPVITLDDGTLLGVLEVSETMIVATIPATTPAGDYTLVVTTGAQSKQTASTTISLGGTLSVVCIDWFRSGPRDEHVHTEVHVEDENGNAVIGAIVTWTSENDVVGVYQTNVSASQDIDGHADGQGCTDPTGSGVTDWFCCIGAGKWDGNIPGKRACDEGFYSAEILSVTAPPSTNMIWDGETPDNGIFLEPKPQ